MSGEGETPKKAFDSERYIAEQMAQKGFVDTGGNNLLHVKPETGAKIAEEIHNGSRFIDSEYDAPEGIEP